MRVLSEFQYPTRWYAKLVIGVLAIAFFTLLAGAIIGGYFVYNIVISPPSEGQTLDLANFPGQPEDVSYSLADRNTGEGWFFPGLKSAPTILLCPGYRVSRGELLPLATALQNHQYNVFLFDFDRRGNGSGYSTLGFHEVQELRLALTTMAQRQDVDSSRFGVWGTDMGGYAAMALAESDSRIRALAVESVYNRPQDMVRLLGTRNGLASLPLLRDFAERGFLLLNYEYRNTPPLSAGLALLEGRPKLFLESAEEHDLVESTHELFVMAPEPKEEVLLDQGNYAGMLDDQKRTYENRIVSFFLLNLPSEARSHP